MSLQSALFLTNFKNYEQSTGKNAVELAKIHEAVAGETGANIGVCVAAPDLYRVAQAVSIPVYAQHVDGIDYGKFTGHILPQSVKNAGAVGTLLNHSERRLLEEDLECAVTYAQKANLMRIICCEDPEEVEHFASFQPDFLAFEPPELIGSSSKSVSSEKPESIETSVRLAQGIPLMIGAGVNSPQDIRTALALGAKGFLIATAIVKADNPEAKLRELVSAARE